MSPPHDHHDHDHHGHAHDAGLQPAPAISAPPVAAPLTPAFHSETRRRLCVRAEAAGVDGLLLLTPANIAYATGWFYSPNERPHGLWVPVDGDPVLFLPELERENGQDAGIEDLRCYEEFPGPVPPVLWMADQIGPKRIVVDRLDATLLAPLSARMTQVDLTDLAMRERFLKRPEELAIHRAAAYCADIFLNRLLAHGAHIIAAGGTEQDLLADGLAYARAHMGVVYADFAAMPCAIAGTVHSGPRAALPHGSVQPRKPLPGETLIAGIGARLGGYHSESGATFTVGSPTREQRQIHAAMSACTQATLASAKPGAACAAVNEAAMSAIRDAGYGDAIRHRIGHGMGLENHEAPWLAPGDSTEIAETMVFSCEPGIYRPEIDGWRCIDTLIIGPNGAEVPSRFLASIPPENRVLAL